MRSRRGLFIITCVVLALVAITTVATAASITGISPASADRDTTITAVVTGVGFGPGAEVTIMSGRTIYAATRETTVGRTGIRCTLTIPADAPLGLYAVRVVTPGAGMVTRADAFRVTEPVPTTTATQATTAPATTAPTTTVTTTSTATATVIVTGTPSPTPTSTTGASYAQAAAFYGAGGEAWSRAWGASDVGQIRQYLVEAKTAYTDCLRTANAVDDPANAANLALVRSISAAYISLADAALEMYDGADVFGSGRSQMTGGSYAQAAESFQGAADAFEESQRLFNQATVGLQAVVYAGTEYGDGTAYTAVIVPILETKAAYMGEFSSYADGWQHTAHAYTARMEGDEALVRDEVQRAARRFTGLKSSAAFSADAAANLDVLRTLVPAEAEPPGISPMGTFAPMFLTVTGISPESHPSTINTHIDIYGSGFQEGAQVKLVGRNCVLEGYSEQTVSPTQIKCSIDIPSCNACQGDYDVCVQNPDMDTYDWVSKPWTFRVTDYDNPITIEPAWANAGETVTLVVHDEDGLMRDTTQVKLLGIHGQTIEGLNEHAPSGGGGWGIECTLVIPADAIADQYFLYTQEPGETAWVSEKVAMSVVNGPTITWVEPDFYFHSTTSSHRVHGLNFKQGAQVRLVGPYGAFYDADDETVHPSQIDLSLTLPEFVVFEWHPIEVQNPGMNTWYRKSDGMVVAPYPRIVWVEPDGAKAGETATIDVWGVDFISTAGFQAGITGQNRDFRAPYVLSLGGGHVAFTLALPADAPAGSYAVYVSTNADLVADIPGTVDFKYDAFQIYPP